MLTGKELGAAIESARIAKGVSKKKLAEDFGVKPPSVQGWVNTGRINKSALMRLMDYFSDVVGPEHWGLSAQMSSFISQQGVDLADQEPEYPRTPHEDDYALIPQYTARGGCGDGFLNGHVEVKGSLAFKREWLAKMKAKPENLRVMYAHGDSMEPYIFEGEVVLFDISEKEPRDKKVFVIRRPDGDISIKRLAQRLDGTWIVSSDNPDKTRFRDETYLPDALHEIPIVGRVIWRGGEVD